MTKKETVPMNGHIDDLIAYIGSSKNPGWVNLDGYLARGDLFISMPEGGDALYLRLGKGVGAVQTMLTSSEEDNLLRILKARRGEK